MLSCSIIVEQRLDIIDEIGGPIDPGSNLLHFQPHPAICTLLR
jgi:hypothetical protein